MLTKIKSGLAGVLVVALPAAVLATGVDNRAASQTNSVLFGPSAERPCSRLAGWSLPGRNLHDG